MDLNEMLIFAKVVQAGSFTRAARTLGLPKSTLSRKVSELEKRLGVRLLQRNTRNIRATEIGAAYFERCARIVSEVEEADQSVRNMQSVPQGTLSVTTTVEFGASTLTPLIDEFLRQNEKVNIRVLLTARVVDLIDEGIDVAIRMGQLEDSSLSARKLGTDSMRIFASPSLMKATGIPKSPRDLQKLPCLHFTGLRPEPVWDLVGPQGEARVEITSRFSSNNVMMVRDLAVAGHGFALMPQSVCETEIKAGTLKQVMKEWTTEENPIHAVFPSQRFPAPKVRAFIDFIAARLKP